MFTKPYIYLSVSLIIHAGLFLKQPENSNVAEQSKRSTVKLQDKPLRIGIRNCKVYKGIGISYTILGNITKVAKGYPADLAGIRVGDNLLAQAIVEDKAYLILKRLGKELKFVLNTESICYND